MFRVFIIAIIVSLFFVVQEDVYTIGGEYVGSTRISEFFEPDSKKSRKTNTQPMAKVYPLHLNHQRRSGGGTRSGGKSSSSRGSASRY